jgi:hypothetical protein
MATAATVTIRLDGDSATLIRELNKANQATTRTFSGMQRDAAAAAKALGLVGLAAAAAFGALTKRAFDSVDALVKASDQLGATTSSLAGLKLAGAQAGVGFESVVGGMLKMQRSLVDATTKGGELAAVYERLGVNTRELLKLTPDQQLSKLADAFAQIQNPAERTALAMQIFGKGGTEMLPMLAKGGGEMAKWAEQADRLGIALSNVEAQTIDDAGDALGVVALAAEGVATQFALAIAPSITKGAQGIVDFIAKADGFKSAMTAAAGAVATVGEAFGESRAAAALFSGVGAAILTGLVNAANLLRLALLGIDLAFMSIDATIRRIKGEQPFDDIGSQAKSLTSDLSKLRIQAQLLEATNIGGINTDGIASLKKEIADTEAKLKALGAPGKLAPLVNELDRLKARRVDLGAVVNDRSLEGAQAQLRKLQGMATAAKAAIETGGQPGWIDNIRAAGIRGVDTLDELQDRYETLQRSIAQQQGAINIGQTGLDMAVTDVRALDKEIAALQGRIKAEGGEILLTVPKDAPLTEYGELLRDIAAKSKEAQAIPLWIGTEQILADAKKAGDEAATAFAESAAAAPPATFTVSAPVPQALDFSNLLADATATAKARVAIEQATTDEIRRIAIAGEQDVSAALQASLAAMAANLTDIQRRQAENQAKATGKPVDFDEQAALLQNQVRVTNAAADQLIAARERVAQGGPLALPARDAAGIQAETEMATQVMLAAYATADAQRLEAQKLLNETLYLGEQEAGQALIELAAQQAREKVIAEFEARGQAMDETGQFADPETRAAFEKAVQDETLARESDFLNQRLQMQSQFGQQYLGIQKLITTLTGKTWADSNRKQLSNAAAFATGAIGIANALFGENKAIAIGQAIVSTYTGAANALSSMPYPANLAAAATVIATGLAQVQSIRSANKGGGGGFSGGGAAASAPSVPDYSSGAAGGQAAGSQAAIQIVVQGDLLGWDDFMRDRLVGSLRDIVDGSDVVIFGPGSRQAAEIRGGG